MADTDFSDLTATNALAATDQIIVVRGGIPYRFNGTLPNTDPAGNYGFGIGAPGARIDIQGSASGASVEVLRLRNGGGGANTQAQMTFYAGGTKYASIRGGYSAAAPVLAFDVNNVEVARMEGGNLLVGTSAGTAHALTKAAAEAGVVLNVYSTTTGFVSLQCFAVANNAWNGAACGVGVGKHSSTGRSINAAGTVNASGADYAEYMTKAPGCGEIGKGDVCGVDRNGQLTRSWAEAISFVVKSTDPSYVGGDSWGAHLGARPEAPAPVGPEPQASFVEVIPDRAEGEDEAAFEQRLSAWYTLANEAAAARVADHAEWLTAKAAFDAAQAEYEAALPVWEAAFEEARQKVDRIAFAGQVPVNVDAETLAECDLALDQGLGVYLVATDGEGGIKAVAMLEAAMTLPLYMRRLGKVWAIRDGRPIIDVQHG